MSNPQNSEKTGELKRAVKIVDNPKILADPIRREILRLLTIKPQTITQLAEKLNLSKSTVGHHIRVLRRMKLVKIKVAKPGSHGILEKYYEPVALVFVENYDKIPKQLKKYFINIHMERLRGVLSTLQLVGDITSAFQTIRESWEHIIKIPSDFDLLNELADEAMKYMTEVGRRYENMMTTLDGETLLTKIYSETLRSIITSGIWRKIFESISEITTLIKEEKSE